MNCGQYAAVNSILIKKIKKKIIFFLPSIPYHRIIINSTVWIPFKRLFLCRSHTFVFGSLRLCVKDWKLPQQNKTKDKSSRGSYKKPRRTQETSKITKDLPFDCKVIVDYNNDRPWDSRYLSIVEERVLNTINNQWLIKYLCVWSKRKIPYNQLTKQWLIKSFEYEAWCNYTLTHFLPELPGFIFSRRTRV